MQANYYCWILWGNIRMWKTNFVPGILWFFLFFLTDPSFVCVCSFSKSLHRSRIFITVTTQTRLKGNSSECVCVSDGGGVGGQCHCCSRNKKIVFWHFPLFTVCHVPIMVTLCTEKVEGFVCWFCDLTPQGCLTLAWLAWGCEAGWVTIILLIHSEWFAFIWKDHLLILLDSLWQKCFRSAESKMTSFVLSMASCLKCARCHARREDRESRFLSSRMAIVAAFRSWSGKDFSLTKQTCYVLYPMCFTGECEFNIFLYSGIIHLCKAGNSGIQSLIGLLCIPNMEVRVSIERAAHNVYLFLHSAAGCRAAPIYSHNWLVCKDFLLVFGMKDSKSSFFGLGTF